MGRTTVWTLSCGCCGCCDAWPAPIGAIRHRADAMISAFISRGRDDGRRGRLELREHVLEVEAFFAHAAVVVDERDGDHDQRSDQTLRNESADFKADLKPEWQPAGEVTRDDGDDEQRREQR